NATATMRRHRDHPTTSEIFDQLHALTSLSKLNQCMCNIRENRNRRCNREICGIFSLQQLLLDRDKILLCRFHDLVQFICGLSRKEWNDKGKVESPRPRSRQGRSKCDGWSDDLLRECRSIQRDHNTYLSHRLRKH